MEDKEFKISPEYIDELIGLVEHVRDAQFSIGDALMYIIELHGGQKSKVIKYLAGVLQISASSLYDYHRVAKIWTPDFRQIYQSLDWSIYRNANPNDPEDRALLDRCIDEGWNASRFREEKYPNIKDPVKMLGRAIGILGRIVSGEMLDNDSQYEKVIDAIMLLEDVQSEKEYYACLD